MRVAMFVASAGTNLTTEMTASGGTTHAAAIAQRQGEMEAAAGPGVEVVRVDRDEPRAAQLAALREVDAVVACFATAAGAAELGCGALLMSRLPELPRLRLVQLLSSGFDEYFTPAEVMQLHARGVAVCNNGGANAAAVSETAVWLTLAVQRGLVSMVTHVRAGQWRWPALQPGAELTGLTVGVVGFGNVGRQVRAASGRLSALVNRFCMGLLYGRAGRLPTKNTCFRAGRSRGSSAAASTARCSATTPSSCPSG
jgi:phosphoglycerate dehydrogenase-like enzyme